MDIPTKITASKWYKLKEKTLYEVTLKIDTLGVEDTVIATCGGRLLIRSSKPFDPSFMLNKSVIITVSDVAK